VVAIHHHRCFHDRPVAGVGVDLERPAEHFTAGVQCMMPTTVPTVRP
jgi:hypothetical protein